MQIIHIWRFLIEASITSCGVAIFFSGSALAQTPAPSTQSGPSSSNATQSQAAPTPQNPVAISTQSATNGAAGQGIPSTGFGIGLGDTIILRVDTPGFRAIDNSQAALCAGEKTALIVSAVSSDGGQTLYVRLATPYDFPLTISLKKPQATQCQAPSSTPQLSAGIEYSIAASALNTHEYSAAGFEYGVLLTPYKFHISDRSLITSATIGPYVGFHILTSPGSEVSEVFSIGIGSVSVASPSSSPTGVSTSNQVSLSIAEGAVWTLTKAGKFQMAFLVGIDWLGNGKGYQYEGKPWFGIGFGTSLTQ